MATQTDDSPRRGRRVRDAGAQKPISAELRFTGQAMAAIGYLSRAEREIGEALGPLFSGRERTLQRLSATFRRADLVDMLSESEK